MHHPSAPYCLHSSSTDGPHRTLKNQGFYGPHKTLFAAVGAVESEAVERMSERADTAYSPRVREEEHSAAASRTASRLFL